MIVSFVRFVYRKKKLLKFARYYHVVSFFELLTCENNFASIYPSILLMWNNTEIPLAYFISFRTHGTWLHGDSRGSIDRSHNNYQSPYLAPNENWLKYNRQLLKAKPVMLRARQRASVEAALEETCRFRNWCLLASNVRTNHVHTVVSADRAPGLVLNALKANCTRHLRGDGLWSHPFSPWADKGSKRMLWNEQSVAKAIDYVLYGQGDDLPDFNE